MYDIIFINPPVDTSTFEGKLARKGGILPPLGLLALAAYSKKAGFNVALIDAFGLGLNFEETAKKVVRIDAKAIGITAFTTTVNDAARIASMIKDKKPEIEIILGGSHLSAVPEQTLARFPQFDIGVIGEGEITVTEILKKNNMDKIDGIIYRDNGRLITTRPRERIRNLDELPFPAFELLSGFPDRYSAIATNFKRLPTTSLVTTRGCPYRCTFCDRHVFGNVCRGHSAEYIIALVKKLQDKYGIKDISFYDDTFVVFKKRLYEICKKIIEDKLDISWSCLARVDIVEPDLLKVMKAAGCWQVSYGIESGSQKILDMYRKNITITQIKTAVRITKNAGLSCRGFFMLGNPLETWASIKCTENLIKEFDDICISFFTPLPGTEVCNGIDRYGKRTQEWAKLDIFTPNFIPHNLSKVDLLRAYRRIHLKFYLRQKIVSRYILRIVRNREIKKFFTGLGAFIQLVFRRHRS